MKDLFLKLKEAFFSVLPVCLIVLILAFTPILTFGVTEYIVFIVCTLLLVIGIALFNLGSELAMTPMGEHMGAGLTNSKNMKILLIVGLVMGVAITVAEPDLAILAGYITSIPHFLFIFIVGIGVGLLLLIGITRIVFNDSLNSHFYILYLIIFALATIVMLNNKGDAIGLMFDASGVTTGPITVPFIMAFGLGIASTVGGRDANNNSFGLVALCSIGPILAVMIMVLCSKGDISPLTEAPIIDISFVNIIKTFLLQCKDVVIALGLLVLFFIIIQVTILHLHKSRIIKITIGLSLAFVGLVVFLTAVKIGYEPIGFMIGKALANQSNAIIIGFGFIIGLVVVLAEPAIQVLNNQVEQITRGAISKRTMLIALSIGVGISIGLSMIRIIFKFSILYYLVPGYLISLVLSRFIPNMYTAIAFDSGGVASGPLTSSFILPMAIGVCSGLCGNELLLSSDLLNYAFGVVAMVAMTPLITIQLLGFKAIMAKKVAKTIETRRILSVDDEQIINF